jgi:hypothetical protein
MGKNYWRIDVKKVSFVGEVTAKPRKITRPPFMAAATEYNRLIFAINTGRDIKG